MMNLLSLWYAALLAATTAGGLLWLIQKRARGELIVLDSIRDQIGIALLVIAGMLVVSQGGPILFGGVPFR